MSDISQSLEQRLDHIEKELSTIKSMLSTLLKQNTPALPQGMDSQTARLIALARHDRAASIAECKRIFKAAGRGA